ncbi:ATP-binding protein [Allonocardiopsis opalescens]|uniref:Histidine kinase-like protein n=1 Tax=Allonocardiopsis opalescens TaxID=1144618 RepID=A0A2T0QC98_9ACTN|nr:ATP-binding protein [Allonocardiopsis opalescens]PRY01576.1 histidine kinase-like protein [Allonocardiopsis opalescens]
MPGPRRRRFTGSADQVREARRYVDGLIDQDCPVRDDALWLVSELATNAIEHTSSAGGSFEVAVGQRPGALRVEVRDEGAEDEPRWRRADLAGLDEESGRGLGFVQLLAQRWGCDGGPDGRSVWFELDWSPARAAGRSGAPAPDPDRWLMQHDSLAG